MKISFKSIENENNILNIIKYGPIIFVITLSLIISSLFIYEKKEDLKKETKILERYFIDDNKKRVKNLVQRVHSYIDLEKKKQKKKLIELIKREVNQAHAIVQSIYNKNIKKENYSKEKTLEEIKTALRNIRFLDNSGYLFVYGSDGLNILNSEFPKTEGKNLWNYKDARGTLILQEMKEILSKQNETLYDWYWRKPSDKKREYKKIGFFKKFEPYDIFIGSGLYDDDIEKTLKINILNSLNSIKYDNFEHIFVYTLNGLCLVNPKKELIGKYRYHVKNKKGEYALRNSLKFVEKHKEGFRYYSATVKVNEALNSDSKISFLKLYEPWEWMIGSGFYLEGLNNRILEKERILVESTNKSIKTILLITVLLTLIFVTISFYLSKQLELRFNNYKKKLEEEVNNSYEKEKLLIQQSKMATMGEMMGSIAHQWKQPLSLLSLSNGLIRISRETKDMFSEKEVDEAVDNIDVAIKNLNQTVDDFRNFFNPNKERSLFKISDAFDETFKLTSSQFRNNNIELIKNIIEVELFGSQNELQQVLINLLKNAKEELVKKEAKFKRYIFIDVTRKENLLTIRIKDNANGIPEDILERVFEAYFTTKEDEGGSGIGLYMCKQIVEGHMKGKIEAVNKTYSYNDEEYKGAEFIISVPLDLREDKKR